MSNLATQETLLASSDVIKKMQAEMFKSNLSKEVEEITTGLEKLTKITSDIEAASATGVLAIAKKIRKIGEDKRKEKTASLDNTKKAAIEAERSFFKDLDDEIKTVSDAVLAFKNEQVRIANEKAKAIKEQAEKDARRKRSVEGVAKVEAAAQEQVSEIAPVSGMRKTWQFEVTDQAKVPSGFLMVNEAAIKQAIKNGVREIDGVKIFEAYGLSGR